MTATVKKLRREVGNWVDGDRFWDRVHEFAELEELLDEGANVLMVAPRRVGKTSLMHETARRLGERYHCLLVDLQRGRGPGDAIVELSLATRGIRSLWNRTTEVFKNALSGVTGRIDEIGIDELSIKRGHRYITLVVDHDTGRLVWAREGRDAATVARFFAELGTKRTAQLTHVTADMGSWIHTALRRHLPARAVVCIDPFHVVVRVSEALDAVRRQVWNAARRENPAAGRWLKGARFALWKNPEDLTPVQALRLERIRLVNEPLYTAYLLKEALRLVLHEPDPATAARQLDQWLADARSPTSPEPFHAAAATIERYRDGILAALRLRLTNARIEAVNTTLRLLVRRAYGFHTADAMIALATLKLGGERLPLPTSA